MRRVKRFISSWTEQEPLEASLVLVGGGGAGGSGTSGGSGAGAGGGGTGGKLKATTIAINPGG